MPLTHLKRIVLLQQVDELPLLANSGERVGTLNVVVHAVDAYRQAFVHMECEADGTGASQPKDRSDVKEEGHNERVNDRGRYLLRTQRAPWEDLYQVICCSSLSYLVSHFHSYLFYPRRRLLLAWPASGQGSSRSARSRLTGFCSSTSGLVWAASDRNTLVLHRTLLQLRLLMRTNLRRLCTMVHRTCMRSVPSHCIGTRPRAQRG